MPQSSTIVVLPLLLAIVTFIAIFYGRERAYSPKSHNFISAIAAIPAVRAALVARQRAYAREHDLVMEGRDIGTVVFPCTPFKAYIDASEEVRAQRRAAQGIRDNLAARDRKDSTRAAAPLKIAEGAQVIDSTHLSIEDVVDEVIRRLGL